MQEGAQSAQANTKSTPEDQEWEQFKAKYNKSYASKEEENYRRSIFEETAKSIKAHNEAFERGETTWTQGIYEWSDLTSKEFAATRCGHRSLPEK